ncbi:rhodanese-like domain-containing protein [Hymenobacter gummosus]|uniref:Rhodanese-like domain-containing protein n=1 Tax=Hymenobacter gummosus TaxID=1776032 RepID=A0A431U7F2_9BACT|nr:rhodanese-like domain-containing protein [Hymenobacter gummosus]RTQ52392.1 rhodanese-like domain-containing protein [Hymenobacter gummosus]
MKRVLLMWSALLALVGCGSAQDKPAPGASPAYAALLKTLYKNTVPTLSAAELARLRQRQPALILLDTRSAAEYQVSHLPGARFIDYDAFTAAAVRDLPREQPVVVYCSVGVRSERIGEQLKALGFRDVRNLYGGLFQWSNEARPLIDAHGPTQRVHPYSALWGTWLTRAEKAYQ